MRLVKWIKTKTVPRSAYQIGPTKLGLPNRAFETGVSPTSVPYWLDPGFRIDQKVVCCTPRAMIDSPRIFQSRVESEQLQSQLQSLVGR